MRLRRFAGLLRQKAELLKQFRVKAAEGQIIDIAEIKASYEEAVGHTIGSGQIYQVLHRHNWRKVMPHSKHPKKSSKKESPTILDRKVVLY